MQSFCSLASSAAGLGNASGFYLGSGSVDSGKAPGFGAHLLKQAALWSSRLFPSAHGPRRPHAPVQREKWGS